jgi:hypothetical protein
MNLHIEMRPFRKNYNDNFIIIAYINSKVKL